MYIYKYIFICIYISSNNRYIHIIPCFEASNEHDIIFYTYIFLYVYIYIHIYIIFLYVYIYICHIYIPLIYIYDFFFFHYMGTTSHYMGSLSHYMGSLSHYMGLPLLPHIIFIVAALFYMAPYKIYGRHRKPRRKNSSPV